MTSVELAQTEVQRTYAVYIVVYILLLLATLLNLMVYVAWTL